jgi:hypothetical protein
LDLITVFASHDAVFCLRCNTRITGEPTPANLLLGAGRWRSAKCPRCQLVTSYDIGAAVTPAEATAIELEEPDWRERFEAHCLRYPKLPRYLAEESGFNDTLRDWRLFHGVPVEINGQMKKQPAGATEGMIALASLRIFPPRSLIKDLPRDGVCHQEQHDDHMWLILSQRAWRIVAVESRTVFLEGFEGEKKQVDLIKAQGKWADYCLAANASLEAQRKAPAVASHSAEA